MVLVMDASSEVAACFYKRYSLLEINDDEKLYKNRFAKFSKEQGILLNQYSGFVCQHGLFHVDRALFPA